MFCQYYQATVNVPYTWFVTGVFRSEDNVVFERTMDNDSSILEFFVPDDYEDNFLKVIQYLHRNGYIINFEKKENRLSSE